MLSNSPHCAACAFQMFYSHPSFREVKPLSHFYLYHGSIGMVGFWKNVFYSNIVNGAVFVGTKSYNEELYLRAFLGKLRSYERKFFVLRLLGNHLLCA